jgi:hypothetical protein
MKAAFVVFGALFCLGVQAETPTPVCQNERQCEAMWLAAQGAIGVATGMPNRIVTDTRIETLRATSDSRLTAVVTKVPTGDEGYKIIVDLSCYRSKRCDALARFGTEVFNTLVIDAGASSGPLPEATTFYRLA